jgi:hypothetical protein
VVQTLFPPTGVTALPLSAAAKVSWKAPTNTNGSAVTGYVVTPYLAGVAKASTTFGSGVLSGTVSGLTNGKSYTFRVAAKNARGTGDGSAASAAIIVGTRNAPAITSLTAGAQQVTVHWNAPAANGTSAVTGYVVTPFKAGVAQSSQSFASTARSGVMTGLTSGVAYTFKIAAQNSSGTGPSSAASAAVTPT